AGQRRQSEVGCKLDICVVFQNVIFRIEFRILDGCDFAQVGGLHEPAIGVHAALKNIDFVECSDFLTQAARLLTFRGQNKVDGDAVWRTEGTFVIERAGQTTLAENTASHIVEIGYDYNLTTQHAVNGRDLWSGRATLALNPASWLHSSVVWEHFQEDDNRSRTGKQLCHHDAGPDSVGSVANLDNMARGVLSQGCLPGSLYDKGAFGTPNGIAINFVLAAEGEQTGRLGYKIGTFDEVDILQRGVDPYGGLMQSTNLREIASIKDPKFNSKNDILEYNADMKLAPDLTLSSLTGYNKDTYYSTQDYNRFNTVPIFNASEGLEAGWPIPGLQDPITPGGVYCDPQIGCSNTIAGFDISEAKSWQFSQEVRLTSNFEG